MSEEVTLGYWNGCPYCGHEYGTVKDPVPMELECAACGRRSTLSIVREDQVRVSPREVHERAMELWVNEGAPGDELPEGRHYRRALADLEGEG